MQLLIGMLSISLWDLVKMQLLACNNIPGALVWSFELTTQMHRSCLQSPEPVPSAFGNGALGLQPQSWLGRAGCCKVGGPGLRDQLAPWDVRFTASSPASYTVV